MEPLANNGTLRLPLKTAGLHDSESTLDQPADPVSTTSLSPSTTPTSTATLLETSEAAPAQTSSLVQVDPVDEDKEKPPSDGDDDDHQDDGQHRGGLLGAWDWLTEKLDGLWDKLTGSS
jgi:hypothetical protein